jgi:hypothetical protein
VTALEDRTVPAVGFYGLRAASVEIVGNVGGSTAGGGHAGLNPIAIATADFNGDGKPDLITANNGDDTFTVLPDGIGGNLIPPHTLGSNLSDMYGVYILGGDVPDAVAVGDFNGDGRPDVAVAGSDGSLTVVRNTGTRTDPSNGVAYPTFSSPNAYYFGSPASAVAVADFNGDGKADIAIGQDGVVSVFWGNGNGTFQIPANFAVGGDPYSLAVADVNGDGKPDLVSANNTSDNVSVLLNKGGSSGFQAAINYAAGSSPESVAVGDFNGDGKPDLAVADRGGNDVTVLLNSGGGVFQAPVHYAAGTQPFSVSVGDINGDGKPDLAVANFGNGANGDTWVSVYLGRGNGTFQAAENSASMINPSGGYPSGVGASGGTTYASMALADLDGDGKLDLAVADYSDCFVAVMLNAGTPILQPGPVVPPPTGSPRLDKIGTGDFNNDGKPDLILPSGVPFDVYLGNGDETFQAPIDPRSPGAYADGVVTGDFNGDGKLDVIAENPGNDHLNGLAYEFLGNGDGSFTTPPTSFRVLTSPYVPMATGDFNGDGMLDFVTAGDGQVQVFLNHGAGVLGYQSGDWENNMLPDVTFDIPNGLRIGDLEVADFNDDGKPDLAIGSSDVGSVMILLGNGDGTFQAPIVKNVDFGNSPSASVFVSSVAVGDFDGRHDANGRPILDLAVTGEILNGSVYSSGVDVFRGNGDGTFQDPDAYDLQMPGVSWGGVGDFNGDGRDDLIEGGYAAPFLTALLGNGDGTFQHPSHITLQSGDRGLGDTVADFDGDGYSDVCVGLQVFVGISSNITLSNATVAEHQPAGTVVGTLSTTSDDPGNFFNYQFVSGKGADDNASFTIDASGNLKTAASFDWATKSSYSIRVRSTDSVGVFSEKVFTIGVARVPPTVASVAVNGGAAQRSELRSIAVTFSGPVSFAGSAAAAFQLTHVQTGNNVTLSATVSTNAQGWTVVTLTFSGGETDPVSALNGGIASLADGRYTLTVFASQVTAGGVKLDGNGDRTSGDDYVSPTESYNGTGLHLYRLFGDVNGDGVVDPTDLSSFRNTFNVNNTQAGYIAALDANGDGVVDPTDLIQFRTRFNRNAF